MQNIRLYLSGSGDFQVLSLKQAATIPGWMTRQELRWLRRIALSMPKDAVVVELGCWKGRSTAAIAVSHIRLFSVDHFRGSEKDSTRKLAARENVYAAFVSNIRRFGLFVNLIIMDSVKTARLFPDRSIAWLFVDDDHHNFGSVFKAWLPKISIGGLASGHDYNPPFFPEIYRTLRASRIPFSVFPMTHIWYFIKRGNKQ